MDWVANCKKRLQEHKFVFIMTYVSKKPFAKKITTTNHDFDILLIEDVVQL